MDDIILERAAHIWAESLRQPKFDNGDPLSLAGAMAHQLAGAATDEQITLFKTKLFERLKFLRDHEGEETGELSKHGHNKYHLPYHVGCDYGPDAVLAWAAHEAGVDAKLLSWKSDVYINEDHVSASFGYGAPHVYHFPAEGRWLVCKLHGEDMPIIIDQALKGLGPFKLEN